jgi:hypothetical protein
MSDDRRPTWLELARLEQGMLEPEVAAQVQARLELHGPPDTPSLTAERAFADQPAALFLGQVGRRAAAIGRLRLLGMLAVGAAVAAALLAVRPRAAEESTGPTAPSTTATEAATPWPAPVQEAPEPVVELLPGPAPEPEPEPEPEQGIARAAAPTSRPGLDDRHGRGEPRPTQPGDRAQNEAVAEAPLVEAQHDEPDPPIVLLPPPSEPTPRSADRPTGSGRTESEPPPDPTDLEEVALYATRDDLWRGRATGTARTRVATRGLYAREPTAGEPLLFWTLDLKRSNTRALGRVFAFAAGGEIYVNEDAPRPTQGERYGKLTRVGDRGVYVRQICSQVGGSWGSLQCVADLRVMDLSTGKATSVGRIKLRRWLEAEPELRARFMGERDQGAETVRRYLVKLLELNPAAVQR